MTLKEKVVLVTGSSRGIGASCIIEFAKKGYNVVINYNNSVDEANNLKEFVESNYEINALVIKADISNEEEVKNMIDKVIDKFGKIDILVNNAAVALDNYLDEKDYNEFKKVIDINLNGTFLVTKLVGEKMLENKSGVIINVSSTNGIDTNNLWSIDYDASKAGVISLTHNFALQYAPYIRVNAVAPGWTNTQGVLEMNPTDRKKETDKILLKRFANPEEIAKVIVFLASDDASYINNTIIRVDGGY